MFTVSTDQSHWKQEIVNLPIEVARALGPAVMPCVHSPQLALAVPELPQTQDTAGPATGEVSGGVFT